MRFRLFAVLLCGLLAFLACSNESGNQGLTARDYGEEVSMNTIAEAYVKLVLEIGLYDGDFVDAYYGPEEWRPAAAAKEEMLPFKRLQGLTVKLQTQLLGLNTSGFDEAEKMRHRFLQKQLVAVSARLDLLSGKKLSFDDESRALYDAQAPIHDEAYFQTLLVDLEKALPGAGSLSERLSAFKTDFIIPKEKLDTVFKAAIDEARKRTLEHLALPPDENFTVEYVTDKPWSGYNWYKGNSFSLIQVNTDLSIYIDRAVDLACHEGYPGHHVYNVLLEKHLVRDRGWVEFAVYPLFSPQSLIAEGSANYGIEVAFPGEERVEFEREVLFKLAGIDPARAAAYYEIQDLTSRLSYAGNEAARNYLDGKITAEQAADWLTRFALMAPERAQQRVKFIDKYRSYVINYNLGLDIVREYIESNGGTPDQPEKRWQLFAELLSAPNVASDLVSK
ncbi:MAG TPA: hypothetical protein VF982_02200 [Anaerolineales bacterium]